MPFWNRITDDRPVEHSVVLATDGSGSMAGQKIEDAKKATVSFARDICSENNELALVLFGPGWRGVQIILKFCRNVQEIERAVAGFRVENGTPFLQAMQVAYDDLLKNAKGKPVLVLITDGLPTDASCEEILKYGQHLKEKGVRIITVAIGEDADREFLRKLASKPDDFYFSRFSVQLEKTYRKIASGLVATRKRA
jgi:Mg-chelatase subunit ChlD